MTELFDNYDQVPVKRPQFLTIICILTFIGSGWMLFAGVLKYVTAEKQAQVIAMSTDKALSDLEKNGDDAAQQKAKTMVTSFTGAATAENLRKSGISDAIAAMLCLGGALIMWRLKRIGFYIYILGTLVGIVAPFVIYGSNNLLSILSSVFVGFFGIVFVILYGLNVKYMK